MCHEPAWEATAKGTVATSAIIPVSQEISVRHPHFGNQAPTRTGNLRLLMNQCMCPDTTIFNQFLLFYEENA
jgi:hypothetical protein